MLTDQTEEILEIWDWKTGKPTGKSANRDIAHRDGIPHESVHLWIIRSINDYIEILFQHRSKDKKLFCLVDIFRFLMQFFNLLQRTCINIYMQKGAYYD